MTAYVTIPNGDVDPESPITTSLMVALRDNPTAITEGAVGAPEIAAAALVDALQTWEHIQTNDITGAVATSDFSAVFDSTYDYYKMVIKGLNVSVDSDLVYLRFETGGSTWQTTGYGGASATYMECFPNIGSAAGESGDATVLIFKPSSAAEHTRLTSKSVATTAAGTIGSHIIEAGYLSVTPVTGIRLYGSFGNLTLGVISLYGMKYRGT